MRLRKNLAFSTNYVPRKNKKALDELERQSSLRENNRALR
jgi:hypothetical protein